MLWLLWPTGFALSEKDKQFVVERLNYWEILITGNFFLMFAGLVFSPIFVVEYIAVMTGSQSESAATVVTVLIVSLVPVLVFKLFTKLERTTIKFDLLSEDELFPPFPKNLFYAIYIPLMLSFPFLIILILPGSVSDHSIVRTYRRIGSGEASWIQFILNVLYHVIYAEAVATVFSSIVFTWYRLVPVIKKLRVWFARIRLFLSFTLTPTDSPANSFSEFVQTRCDYCWKEDFHPKTADGATFLCSFCGHEYEAESSKLP